jgi:hypothetical protein
MGELLILQPVRASAKAAQILDEFERRTGLEPDQRDDARYYELHGDQHGTRVVQTLNEIDSGWSDHIALKAPG